MDIYRTFTRQTDYVVQYLSVARLHEHHTRVEVPKLKHAPVNLGRQLEDYLKDPDFEIHRRQYMAEQDAKKKGVRGPSSKSAKATGLEFPKTSSPAPNSSSGNPFPAPGGHTTETRPQANKGPDPDLIDFFDSIEQNQTPMQVNPQQPQQTGMPFPPNGFVPQPTGFVANDPYQQQQNLLLQQQQQQQQLQQQQLQQQQLQQQQLQQQQQQQQQLQQQQHQQLQQPQQLQPNFTGAGFGGFTPQPQPQQGFHPGGLGAIPQNSTADFQSQQFAGQQFAGQPPMQMGQPTGLLPQPTGTTNPFRQSMMMAQQTGMQTNSTPPFASPAAGAPALNRQSTNPFARSSPQPSPSPSPFSPQPLQPLQPTPTGTNPFARSSAPQSPVQQPGIAPQPTGATNPFRQGAFVNHATGMGWQHSQAPIGGGIDQLQTMPVFPRPAQQTPWQQ